MRDRIKRAVSGAVRWTKDLMAKKLIVNCHHCKKLMKINLRYEWHICPYCGRCNRLPYRTRAKLNAWPKELRSQRAKPIHNWREML